MAKSKLKAALASQQSHAVKVAAKKRAQAAEEAKKASVKASLSGTKKGLKRAKNVNANANANVRADKAGSKARTDGTIGGEAKGKGQSKEVEGSSSVPAAPVKTTIPIDKQDTILLLGEGNFSFSLSLLLPPHSVPGYQILATAYDSETTTYDKYPDAKAHVDRIREQGGKVEFGVDAGALERCKAVGKGRKWSRVVFNFPHVGAGITDQDRNILSNQTMLLRFFRSVEPFLTEGPARLPPRAASKGKGKGSAQGQMRLKGKANGKALKTRTKAKNGGDSESEDALDGVSDDEPYLLDETNPSFGSGLPHPRAEFTPPKRQGSILLTLLTCPPYTLWSVPQLASRPPALCPGTHLPQPVYDLVRSFEFRPEAYAGYEHRRTIGWKEGVSKGANEEITGRKGKARTWEFVIREKEEED